MSAPTVQPGPSSPPAMSLKILVVDDDPRMLLALRTRLGGTFTIETARTAEVALELVRTGGPYALVVSDLRMPGMGGGDLLKSLIIESPDTERILLSGISDPAEVQAAISAGQPAHVLSKPFNARDLSRIAHEAVERYKDLKAASIAQDEARLHQLGALFEDIPASHVPVLVEPDLVEPVLGDDEGESAAPLLLESDAMEEIPVQDLRVNHRLLADLMSADGVKLLAAGRRITGSLRSRVLHFAERVPVQEPLFVELLPDEDSIQLWRPDLSTTRHDRPNPTIPISLDELGELRSEEFNRRRRRGA